MVAKKKSVPTRKIQEKPVSKNKKASASKAKPSSDGMSDNEFLARSMARDVTYGWLAEPRNRTQVIMPPGKLFVTGTDSYYTKTKGRFRAADQKYQEVYTKSRADLKRLYPEGELTDSSVKKASTKAKKKK